MANDIIEAVDFLEQYRQRKLKNKSDADAIVNMIGTVSIEVAETLAHVVYQNRCPELTIEWILEKYWGMVMKDLFPRIEKIYDTIVNDEKRIFNDLDDKVWVVQHSTKKVLCHTTQSQRFLYVWDKKNHKYQDCDFTKLHIRHFYDKFELDQDDKYDVEEDIEFKEEANLLGKAIIAKYATRFEEYADDEYQYTRRPSLDWFRKKNFEFRYGDCRDEGYIGTWDAHDAKVDRAYINQKTLDYIRQCYIPSIEYEVFGEENENNT